MEAVRQKLGLVYLILFPALLLLTMSIALRSRAVRAYADLLRAQRSLFGEDTVSRLKALAHTRLKFRENEKLADPKKIEELVHQAEQASVYLEQNVVQGVKNTKGPFKLNITEKTHKTTDPTPNLHF